MTLSREEVTAEYPGELARFSELIRSLSDQEWARPSRCEGWTVADVAGHVVGLLSDVVNGRLEGLGTPEMTVRQVEDRRGRSPAELADELDQSAKLAGDLLAAFDDAAWDGPAPPGVQGTLGFGVEALWYDTFVHADDIRAATGRPSQTSPALRASVSHVAQVLEQNSWGPATLTLDGMEEFTIGGGGRHITGDPMAFVLAATGRADPAPFGLDETVNIYRD